MMNYMDRNIFRMNFVNFVVLCIIVLLVFLLLLLFMYVLLLCFFWFYNIRNILMRLKFFFISRYIGILGFRG